MAKRPAGGKRKPRTTVRTLVTPVEEYYDIHGDDPPYHDQHDDDGDYTDHADDEHNDYHTDTHHIDEHHDTVPHVSDPLSLITQTIERLTLVMSRFEATYRTRLEQNAASTLSKLEKIEARLTALEKSIRKR